MTSTHVGRAQIQAVAEVGPSTMLAWDGRLDNRSDLLWQVADRGCDATDAALVLRAYDRWGIAGLARVIGDWSLVIRDGRTGDIILASDFAGVRPLYYHWRPGTLLWSPRLEPLVRASGADTIDEQYAAGFLLFGASPARTPYAGIASIPPGAAVRATTTGPVIRRFWSPPVGDVVRFRRERTYDEHFRVLFRDAVAARLRTDGVVLAELSGGLDSSSVVCMAAHLMRSRAAAVRGIRTVSYEYRDSLDTPFIRDVEAFCESDGIHLSMHEIPVAREDGGSAAPEGWAPIHEAVAELARDIGATTLLTGHNGDLVNGNWLDDSSQVAGSLRALRLRRACREALAWSRLVGVPVARVLVRALRAALPRWCAPAAAYAIAGMPGCDDGIGYTSATRSFAERTGMGAPLGFFSTEWLDAPPERRKHFLALTMTRELRSLQATEPLQGLDYTHPFAHRPLVEFLMSVPADVVCRPGEPRRLMRRALAELWPATLRKRRSKSLFHGPWIEALRPLASKLPPAARWQVVERGWIDSARLADRLQRLSHGLDCNAAQLRLIVLLECWLRSRERSNTARCIA